MGSRLSLAAVACAAACIGGRMPAAGLQAEPTTYEYRVVEGDTLRLFVFRPGEVSQPPRPGVLLFHGGGWQAGAPEWTFEAARHFAGLGLVAIPVQYRLSGERVTPIDALADVCESFRWVRRNAEDLGIDPERVAAYGVSAGGHLAASTATVGCPPSVTDDVRAAPDLLLLWSPALDLVGDGWFERLLQSRAPPVDYSPAHHVHAGTPPTSIVHGDRDTLTPLAGARRYCDRLIALGIPCDLNVYPGVGHLLTRNLRNQESDFDPDPVARDDGIASHVRFLRAMRFLDGGASRGGDPIRAPFRGASEESSYRIVVFDSLGSHLGTVGVERGIFTTEEWLLAFLRPDRAVSYRESPFPRLSV